MSTQFRPLQIPPGVVAMPTKKMSSTSWAEVNLVRWREQQLTPMGGQALLVQPPGASGTYTFASRCKKIHGWFDLTGLYHIAYLCERHLYVDTGGTLTDISPVPAVSPAPAGLVGGYLKRRRFTIEGDAAPDDVAASFRPPRPNITMTTGSGGGSGWRERR